MNRDTWMAMVAVEEDALPSADRLAEFLHEQWPDTPPLTEAQPKGNVLTFRIGEAVAALTLFPMPIPWEHLEGPCATAWYWPQATQVMSHHRRHVLVTLIDERRDPIEKALLQTKLVAAVVAACQSIGVFWGPGRLVHPPQPFLDLARDMTREYLPLYLWVDFRIEPQQDGALRLFTTGLEPLGQREIEVFNYRGEPQQLLETVYNIAHYAIDQQKPLSDGDTIGASDSEQIVIRRSQSMFDQEQEVIQLEF